MKRLFYIFSLVAVVSLVACSNQWREADAEISAEEMLALLDDAASASSLSGSGVSQALQFREEEGTAIYFSDAPGPLGTIASVFSIYSYLDFLSPSLQGMTRESLYQVRIFFFNQHTSSGIRAALIVGLQTDASSSFQYFGFEGDAVISDDEYEAVLYNGSGQPAMILRSFDVEGGDLAPVIQLKVSDANDNPIGKFSTLVGFGG